MDKFVVRVNKKKEDIPISQQKPPESQHSSSDANVTVETMIFSGRGEQMLKYRKALCTIFTSLRYLGCQGQAIRGKNEKDSNSITLLQERKNDVPELAAWLKRDEKYKWLSHDVSNEILQDFSKAVLRELAKKVKDVKYFGIMLDETSDVSNKEQISFCFRIVDDNFNIEELFFGFYATEITSSEKIFTIMKDILVRMQFPIHQCRDQCYDGAANMSGCVGGLRTRMQEVEKRAVYVHCRAHKLNLAVQDAMSSSKEIRDAITSNYRGIPHWLQEVDEKEKNTAGVKAGGYLRSLTKFDTFFLLEILRMVFTIIEGGSASLQGTQLNFSKAEKVISTIRQSISDARTDARFSILWQAILASAELNESIDEPQLPRQRKMPRRLDENAQSAFIPQTAKDAHRQLYFFSLDSVLFGLTDRFEPNETAIHFKKIEGFILGREISPDYFSEHYVDDLDCVRLQLHRDMLLDRAKTQERELKTSNPWWIISKRKKQPAVSSQK
eukprot:gene9559-17307_t